MLRTKRSLLKPTYKIGLPVVVLRSEAGFTQVRFEENRQPPTQAQVALLAGNFGFYIP